MGWLVPDHDAVRRTSSAPLLAGPATPAASLPALSRRGDLLPAAGTIRAARDHPLLGRWRIVEMALWDSDFLDLVEPADVSFDAR
jgi:hypothetical protein